MTESLFIRCATLRRCPLRQLAPKVRRPQPPKRIFRYAPIFLLLLAAAACDILEEDLGGRTVAVIAPTEGAEVPPGVVAFRWEAVEGAAGYALRVVTPSFAAARRIVADTLLMADSLGMARSCGCRLRLDEGDYEWCVEAFNGAYASQPRTLRLRVVGDPPPEEPEEDGSAPLCGVGSTPPPHAADCTAPRLVQLLRHRRTAPKHGQWSALHHNAPQP